MNQPFPHRLSTVLSVAALLLTNGCGGGASQGALPIPEPPANPSAATVTAAGLMPQSTTESVTTLSTTPGVPLHVPVFTLWKQSGIATNVPASWAAHWATWVETGTATYAREFHSAGGRYTVAYTDPNYYYVSPTWTSPGTYASSAFGIGSNGLKTHRPQGTGTEYYLLSNSAATQTTFAAVVASIKAAGGYDFIYADGVSDTLPESLYRMSPTPMQITTTSQYVSGMKQTMALSPLPTIINGYNNGDPMTEEQEYIGSRNIVAALGEECFTSYTKPITGTAWISMADALLATTSRHYYGMCGGRGALADNRALRTYWLASFWLTYDPTYSVSLALFSSPGSVYVFAEQTIVPTAADQTVTSVASLKWYTGVYVRRFERCYYKGTLWGACAAVVNPSSLTARIPRLPVTYHHSLALDNNNLYNGGAASLITSVPSALAPGTGTILVQ